MFICFSLCCLTEFRYFRPFQNKQDEAVRDTPVPKPKKQLTVKDKEGNVIDLNAFKSSSIAAAASLIPSAEVKKTIVVTAPVVESLPVKKVEEASKRSAATGKESPVPKVQERIPPVAVTEGSPVSSVEATAASISPFTSSAKQAVPVEGTVAIDSAAVEAEAEAAAVIAAAAKAAEKKKVELDSIVAKKKAEEEAILLKQLQDQEKQRIESDKKRVAVEEEERERKSKAAEVESSRVAAAEAQKIAEEARLKLKEEETKKKAEAEVEKKRKTAEEEEKVIANAAAAAATATATAAADTRSKKVKQKDAMAAKDAANSGDSMLDAYTEPPVGVPAVPVPVVVPIVVSGPEPKVESEQETVEDWEANAFDSPSTPTPLPVPVPVASARRSLRPGGGVDQQRLNAGFASTSNKPKQLYIKSELIKLRPQSPPPETDRPAALASYASLVRPRGPPGSAGTSSEAGGSQKGGGGGGAAWGRGEMKSPHGAQDGTSRPRVLQEGAASGQHQHSEEGWSRSGLLPPPPAQAARSTKSSKVPSGPRPIKVIVDPIEKLSFDVLSILNKITPQTFEKLTGKMCDIPVGTSAELDKMIELVFEKANLDTSFAHLYAEMCATLEVRSSRWAFLQYVHNKDTNQYIWIKDLIFDNILAGPFVSVEECIGATLGAEPPLMQHVDFKVEVVVLNVIQNILITVSVLRKVLFVIGINNCHVCQLHSLLSVLYLSSYLSLFSFFLSFCLFFFLYFLLSFCLLFLWTIILFLFLLFYPSNFLSRIIDFQRY